MESWIPYVGAGISLDSGVPLSGTIVKCILRALQESFAADYPIAIDLLQDCAEGRGFTELPLRMEVVLDECHKAAEKDKSLLDSNSKFYVFREWKDRKPNTVHKFLAERLAGQDGPPVVFTTNIDRLIEEAFIQLVGKKATKRLEVIARPGQFAAFMESHDWRATAKYEGNPLLFKLHGTAFDVDGAEAGETIQLSLRALARHTQLSHKREILKRFADEYSLGFLGYSGRDEFDLLPVLIQIKSQLPGKPWVWLSHVDSEGNAETIKYGAAQEHDPIEKILSRTGLDNSDEVSSVAPNIRMFAHTAKALGQGVPTRQPEVDSKQTVNSWIQSLPTDNRDKLVVELLCAGRATDSALKLFEGNGPLAASRYKRHLFLAYLKTLKGKQPQEGADDIVKEMEREIRELRGSACAKRAAAWSTVAFAWRERREPLKSFRAFVNAEKAARKLDPTDCLRSDREMVVGYHELARLTAPILQALARESEFAPALRALRRTLKKLGVPVQVNDFRELAIDRVRKVVTAAESMIGSATQSDEDRLRAREDLARVFRDGAWILKDMGKPREGLKWLMEAMNKLDRLDDILLRVQLYRDAAWFHWDLLDTKQALKSIKKAGDHQAGLADELETAAIRRDRGFLLCYDGNLAEGLAEMEEAFRTFERLERSGHRLAQTRQEIVQVHRVRGDVLLNVAANYTQGVLEWANGLSRALEHGFSELADELQHRFVEARKRFHKHISEDTLGKIDALLQKTADGNPNPPLVMSRPCGRPYSNEE